MFIRNISYLLLFNAFILNADFSQNWRNMQNVYHQLDNKVSSELIHSEWVKNKEGIKKLINGGPNKNFLSSLPGMVRVGFNTTQYYEQAFIKYCLKDESRSRLNRFAETNIGNLSQECRQFGWSTNTLGQMYYVFRLLEHIDLDNKTVIEFGGGYGCFSRIINLMNENVTYVIFDLPEFLSIQHLFLSSSLLGHEIKVHYEQPTELKKNAINLIPIYYLKDFDLKSDVFFSSFGITEAPLYVHQLLVQKNFFNADVAYVIGQFHVENHTTFPSHSVILEGIRKRYGRNFCQPFHFFNNDFLCYEIMGAK